MKTLPTLLLSCLIGNGLAQSLAAYKYSRPVKDVKTEGWHTLELPEPIFAHLNSDFSDLRLVTITGRDTVEIPYLLLVEQDDIVLQKFSLPIINQSTRAGKQYVTFQLPGNQTVNHIDLTFREKNFNALVTLEGSHDQQTWFTVATHLRIASIQNKEMDYQYTSLAFPDSRFKFLRAVIAPDKPVTLQQATLAYEQVKEGTYKKAGAHWHTHEDNNHTIVTVTLDHLVPVSRLQTGIAGQQDFFRSFSIDGVRDSVETQTGWIKSYESLYTGHLTSLRQEAFNFTQLPVQELRLTIRNEDNLPLTIDSIAVYYPAVHLIAKLQPTKNVLLYGHARATHPSYDLVHFKEKIPEEKLPAMLGDEEEITRSAETGTPPLFLNTLWLWGILLMVVAVLGYFTFKMMRPEHK